MTGAGEAEMTSGIGKLTNSWDRLGFLSTSLEHAISVAIFVAIGAQIDRLRHHTAPGAVIELV